MVINTYDIFEKILKQPHVLIGGTTGAGKSVLINNLIYTALQDNPQKTMFILIDPKRIELIDYSVLPHTIFYVTENNDIINALEYAVYVMETRFSNMQKRREKMFSGADIYIIIDELADLMTTAGKEAGPLLGRIALLGRAGRIHLLIGTQRPTSTDKLMPGQLKSNIDCRIALRCLTPQDSKNIISYTGAENLPKHGKALVLLPPDKPVIYDIPMINQKNIERAIIYWTR